MAHTFIDSAINGSWYNVYVIPGTTFENLDASLTTLLNGDGGGTWAPSSAIVIGGAGVDVLGTWNLTAADIARAEEGLFPPFVLGDSDFFQLTSGAANASRTIRSLCTEGLGFRTLTATMTAGVSLETLPATQQPIGWILSVPWLYLTSFSSSGATIPAPLTITVPMTVHNGATFLQANLTWNVGVTHPNIPEHLPKCRLVAIDALGNMTPLNLQSTTGYDANRYLTVAASFTTGTGYYAAGANQPLNYICDPNTIVDTSKYTYALEIIDEWGPVNSLSGNIFQFVDGLFQDIPDMGFQL